MLTGYRSLGRRILHKVGLRKTAFRRSLSHRSASTLAAEFSGIFGELRSADIQRAGRLVRDVEARLHGRMAGDVEDYALLYHLVQHTTAKIADTGRPRAHVQIGVLFGGSLILAAQALEALGSTDIVLGVDPLAGYYGKELDLSTGLPVNRRTVEENLTQFHIQPTRVRLVEEKSLAPAALQAVEAFDVLSIWIDGDHSYAGVSGDWRAYAPLVAPSGYVLIDNYCDPTWPDVTAFVDRELRPAPSGWRIAFQGYRSILFQRAQSA